MPHYGSYRPSTDYCNSNLIMHNFVMADIVAAVSKVEKQTPAQTMPETVDEQFERSS